MKQLIEANGEKLYINLCYVDFAATTDSAGFEHYQDPEEYAEFTEALFLHLDNKYGVVPDGIEPILEPDNAAGWSAVQIANAIVATGQRLAAHGYHPDFIAPSTANMGNASSYFNTMRTQVPQVLPYLSEISYHRYGGVSDSNLQAIEDIAQQYEIGASMLEWWFGQATYHVLHQDLKNGRNTAWQSGLLSGHNSENPLYNITTADPDNPVVTLNNNAKFLRQYFRFIRPGATRIGAASENANFDPLAFEDLEGKPVVVVKASSGGAFTIGGLPAGVYGINYTTPAEFNVNQPDQTLVGGQELSTSIPRAGVITIYAKQPGSQINAGHAGAWFNPNTSGQGQFIDVVPEEQFLFISWFTFTGTESDHPFEQHWFTAQGNYSGSMANLDLFETLGGKFDDPQAVTTTRIGEVTVNFSDCNQGQMNYNFDEEELKGTVPLLRVIPGSENVCEQLNDNTTQAVDINAGMDGAWFDPGTSGQGYFIDAYPNPEGGNFIFVSWFTFGNETASGQRWLTAQGSFEGSVAEIDVFETTGGSFDDPEPVSTTKVGTMNLDFTDCSNALLAYSLPAESAEGDIAITRVIPGGKALCEDLVGSE